MINNLCIDPPRTLTAQVGREKMHKESHQYIDLVKAFFPLTKWNTSIRHAKAIPEVVRKAFRIAQIEKPRVVHIEFPEDVADDYADSRPLEIRNDPTSHPNEEELKSATNIINDASHQIVLAGYGILLYSQFVYLFDKYDKRH